MHRRILFFGGLGLWTVGLSLFGYLSNGGALGIDDADIFFGYAENLAAGNGITYASGVPVVEGYTSTAWMLLAAAMFFLGMNEIGVYVLGLAIFFFSQVLAVSIIKGLLPIKSAFVTATTLYVFLISGSFGYVAWTTLTLMDIGLWGLVVLWMVRTVMFNPSTPRGWALGAIPFFLSPLARPEALLLVPVLLVLFLAVRLWDRLPLRPVLFLFGVFLLSSLALTSFRLLYFGFPFPNTYYAKVAPSFGYNFSEGVKYLYAFMSENPFASIALPFVLFIFLFSAKGFFGDRTSPGTRRPHEVSKRLFLLSSITLLVTFLPVISGGDHFGLFRFFQPSFPLLSVIFVSVLAHFLWALRPEFLNSFVRGPNWIKVAGLLLFVAWTFLFSSSPNWPEAFRERTAISHEFDISKNGRELGAQLNAVFGEENLGFPTIGVITAGGISRTYQGSIIDLMGLNNSFIAHFSGDRVGLKNHAAFEKAAFFELDVDAVMVSDPSGFASTVLKGLLIDPRFAEDWRFGVVRATGDPVSVKGFFSQEFLETLNSRSSVEFEEEMTFNSELGEWEYLPVSGGEDQ